VQLYGTSGVRDESRVLHLSVPGTLIVCTVSPAADRPVFLSKRVENAAMTESGNDPLRGTVIRASLFSTVVVMMVVLFGGPGVVLLAVGIGLATVRNVAGCIGCLAMGLVAVGLLYLMVWRYYVVIGEDTLADGRWSRRPRQVAPRDAIARVVWLDQGKKMGGLFFDADGSVVLALDPYISERQVKKIAALLDKPFGR
jgi:hypothetical protein